MADGGVVFKAEYDNPSDELSSLFQRRIEFHPARRAFKGFDNGGGDFRLETLNPTTPFSHKSGSNLDFSASKGNKIDGSESFENGLDPELCFEITFCRIGAGLQNLGNTCFLNSVLQCLTYTEPLAAYLQSGKHQNSCHVAGFCALCAIQKHVRSALKSSGSILAPKDLVSNLRCISRNFRNARQEDAHEYMVNLLESMHKCCLPSGLPSESPSAYEKSLVHKIFGGRLQSQVKCMQCSYCSNKFDPFLDLSLDIVEADSLHKAFNNFTTPELLDGGERQYQCQRCKQKVKALKQFTVHKAPYVLTIHLKRFQSSNVEKKINKVVKFGPTLDLKPFVSDSYADGDLKYTLYGVLVHHGGSTRSGHYYCFVRTSSGMWYALDDNQVSHVGESIVFKQQAYMLFYVRDRKKYVPKKPVDVALKKNMKTSTCLNRSDSIVNQGLKQNCIFEKKLNASSSDELRKDSSGIGPSKTTVLNESSVKIESGSVSKECLVPKIVSMPVSSPEKQLGKDIILCSSPAEDLPSLPVCRSSNFVAPNSDSSLAKAADMKISHFNKGLSVPVAASLNLTDANASAIPQAIDNAASTQEFGYKTLEKSDQPMLESIKVDISNQNSVGKLPSEYCEKLATNVSNKTAGCSIMTDGSALSKTPDCKRGRRLKRENLKHPFASLHRSSYILFQSSFSLCKKKKHKRRKCQCANSKSLPEESLLSDFGPSTSDKAKTVYLVSTNKSSKKPKHGSKGGNGNLEALTKMADNECGKRSREGNSVLATEKELKCSTGFIPVANHNESSVANCPEDSKRSTNPDGLHSALSNGFENTIVEQWDGIKLPSSKNQYNGMNNVSIGYVGDEWDEEYDQGKRKKIREFKHIFGGPNPFQEIATKKSQFKKRKLDRSSSGNQPFRI